MPMRTLARPSTLIKFAISVCLYCRYRGVKPCLMAEHTLSRIASR
uniref:RNA synthesis protein n=1 Tax=Siphoviridae sp. ctrpM6 TaxID=2827956 RepID=A0A8S5T4V6_9CAUD|nr:MAG TPA: RNA synthesis protein [Siphoviridae sp. ctrpM6]DAT66565.1 MAG TPA: RNA synthesis protein [Caudoviricetes sp.]